MPVIKKDAPIMQALFQPDEVEVSPERREFLAQKGRRLYAKYCGTKGRGICAESFVEYHLWRGELVVARDFLVFLTAQLAVLRQDMEPIAEMVEQIRITEQLIVRIQNHLGQEGKLEGARDELSLAI